MTSVSAGDGCQRCAEISDIEKQKWRLERGSIGSKLFLCHLYNSILGLSFLLYSIPASVISVPVQLSTSQVTLGVFYSFIIADLQR